METYIAQCRICKKTVASAPRLEEWHLDAMAYHVDRAHGIDMWRLEKAASAGDVLKHYDVREESAKVA